MQFASLTLPELAPILVILAGMLTGFYQLLKYVLKQASDTSEADRAERKLFVSAIDKLTEAGIRQAEATEKAAREAELRNGHLAEISITNKDQILEGIKGLTIEKQTVHNQTVQNEKVIHKE